MTKFLLPLFFLLIFVSCKKEKNNPPIIVDQVFEVDENSLNGTSVGFISASDLEDDVLCYEIIAEGTDFPFQVDLNSGELSVVGDESLDFESQEEYIFVVKVYEKGSPNYSNSSTITINIIDVDEITVGLVAYYPFNGNANDISGNGFHGSVYGATLAEGYNGENDGSYLFDGNNDYVNIGDIDDLKITGDLTLSFWINSKSFSGARGIITCQADYTDNAQTNALYRLTFEDKNYVVYAHESGNGYNDNVFLNEGLLALDTWYYLAVIRDISKKEIRTYVNGQFEGAFPYNENPENGDLATITIGMNQGVYETNKRFFYGKLDEIRIYNRALTANEISYLFNYVE